jgi:arsenite-transporting ATPase
VRESFEPVPILTARLFDREMVGLDLLERMGQEVYGDTDVVEVLHREEPIRIRKRGTSYVLSMRLPFAERSDLDVHRKGDELVVKVGQYKRTLILPQTLQRLTIREASFVDDHLEVRFARETSAGSRARVSAERGR